MTTTTDRDQLREGCFGAMTPARATYFLERFKRDEKMLGPHEQWALDFAIAALATPTALDPATIEQAVMAERERCAKIADGWMQNSAFTGDCDTELQQRAGRSIAAVIRASAETRT